MTVFGKILVFLNLLFSIATGALIVFVFTTRANWVTAYNDVKVRADAAEARYQSEKNSQENDRKQAEVALKGEQSEKDQLATQVRDAQNRADQLQKTADAQTGLTNQAATELQKIQAELNQNKVERGSLVDEKNTARAKVIEIQKQLDDQRHVAVNADLQAKNLVQRVNNLLRQVEELTAANRELEARGSGIGGSGGGSALPPTRSVLDAPATSAPPGVRGKITGVGTSGTSLVQINIGSDSGLSVGNVLIVFRGSEYLGDLILTSTEPKVAVGKLIAKTKSIKVQEGDSVITSFAGTPQ